MPVPIRVNVRYFAVLRDRAGVSDEVFETASSSVRALVDELIEARSLGLASPMIRAAVNGRFAADDEPLRGGDEVVLIPPVAGG